ncbi:MAG: phosphatidylserine decarboxylase family protein [Bacteroidia bacterium]|nr:phosphatidylserine decarboxylase family protein [Bacteroidia bacterium]MCZ2247312.1 phosphatidylserine decarboxylase family protein [Bacteroidia bacterium]
MRIHREGIPTIFITLMLSLLINGISGFWLDKVPFAQLIVLSLSIFALITVLQFFRNPNRKIAFNDNDILSPADGKVVVIEEVEESEYFKDKRIQISVFMSPVNVHVNRAPIKGIVKYVKYHAGLYLVAWHPKSSTDNERTTIVMEHSSGKQILMRQIAGALARRIVYYCKLEEALNQGDEFGFIKFGSRVDVFLPLGTKVNVKLNDTVKGGKTSLASFT